MGWSWTRRCCLRDRLLLLLISRRRSPDTQPFCAVLVPPIDHPFITAALYSALMKASQHLESARTSLVDLPFEL